MKYFVPLSFMLLAATAGVAQQATPQPSQQAQQFAKQQAPSQPAMSMQLPPPQQTVVEEIIARVNNSIITRADLQRSKEEWKDAISHARSQNPADLPQEQDLLRDLIDQQLLLQKGTELGVTADTEVIKRLDQMRQQMHAETMEDVEKAAQAQGVSFEDFKQNMKNQIITQKVIQQEVGGHITITQQQIQEFYDQHKADLERPEQVRLSEILVSTQKGPEVKTEKGKPALPEPTDPDVVAAAQQKADSIYEQLQKGGKFADVAKANSDGPTAGAGGDLEYFKRGVLSKELEDKVFALKAGEFTQPIRTNQGWVILQVSEHQPAGVPPLKDVAPQIQERLYMQQMTPALRDYMTKLREDAYIDIKQGYIDTGASPNETKPVFTTAEEAGAKNAKKKKKFGVF
jgi:peptidyl-prolyl cis-trans isomerase SurA